MGYTTLGTIIGWETSYHFRSVQIRLITERTCHFRNAEVRWWTQCSSWRCEFISQKQATPLLSKKVYAANHIFSQNDRCCHSVGEAGSVSCINQWQQELCSPGIPVRHLSLLLQSLKTLFPIWLPVCKMIVEWLFWFWSFVFFVVDISYYTSFFLVNLVLMKHGTCNYWLKLGTIEKKIWWTYFRDNFSNIFPFCPTIFFSIFSNIWWCTLMYIAM